MGFFEKLFGTTHQASITRTNTILSSDDRGMIEGWVRDWQMDFGQMEDLEKLKQLLLTDVIRKKKLQESLYGKDRATKQVVYYAELLAKAFPQLDEKFKTGLPEVATMNLGEG